MRRRPTNSSTLKRTALAQFANLICVVPAFATGQVARLLVFLSILGYFHLCGAS